MPIAGKSSVLLIGDNGSGKSTVASALEVLQKIGRGTNRVEDLVTMRDVTKRANGSPVRFEIEVELHGTILEYAIAFAAPSGSRDLRVFEEKLLADGEVVYTRGPGQTNVTRPTTLKAIVDIAAGLAALPVLQEASEQDPLFVFKQWLARMLILRPIPSYISGDSVRETLQPDVQLRELGSWFTGLLNFRPSAYSGMTTYLKEIMPDLKDFRNRLISSESRSLDVQFSSDRGSMILPFADLSDGEKCFVICALVLAANEAYGPLLCFWDEPDNYLALSEVGHFVLALRRAFESGGQLIATSHNPEAIRRFSDENTVVLSRNSHLEPTVVRQLDKMQVKGDLVGSLVRGDL